MVTFTTGDSLHETTYFIHDGLLLAFVCVALAFFIGSIPFGVVVARFYGVDIRSEGSGNIGAANALRTLGRGAGAIVLVLDALKGFVPTFLIATHAFTFKAPSFTLDANACAAIVAGAAMLGHCYSPWLGFRGGKGVATNLGAVFALAWPAGLGFAVVWLLTLYACGFASVSSMLASFAMAPLLWFFIGPSGFWYGLVSALFIAVKHRENIARLRSGTENKLSLVRRKRA